MGLLSHCSFECVVVVLGGGSGGGGCMVWLDYYW